MKHHLRVGKKSVFFRINRVAQNRASQIFHVDADLVRASREKPSANQSVVRINRNDVIKCYRSFSLRQVSPFKAFHVLAKTQIFRRVFVHGFEAFSVRAVAYDERVDYAVALWRTASHDQNIFF